MVDIVPADVRSRMMSGIRGKDTKPELTVRRALHAKGFRYKLHDTSMAGKPDIVFPKHGAIVFVHGCFWHGHDCHLFRLPSTRPDFWQAKIEGNVQRDRKSVDILCQDGWRIGTVWECSLKGRTRRQAGEVADLLADWLRGSDPAFNVEGKRND